MNWGPFVSLRWRWRMLGLVRNTGSRGLPAATSSGDQSQGMGSNFKGSSRLRMVCRASEPDHAWPRRPQAAVYIETVATTGDVISFRPLAAGGARPYDAGKNVLRWKETGFHVTPSFIIVCTGDITDNPSKKYRKWMWIRMMEKKLNPTRTKDFANQRQRLQKDMKEF